ncbi:uncharacterized protein FOMMEDRAFT_98200 [Fomitiporia mediterranea MF3/22]|uniref:RecA family profile 1 domain-containing protein n=1 Tax=Fomitiporia mediterranea (strain MF3/22) TaxID=694068 RepID=R7SJJ8_FOMME|nr:uncharacterized protein FOMMEDRAFT_98200 [Fomitiporia mediterranea MF3/22]EJC97744.1 hypothetical protein FOMMEDRAFT_98200 [Fomitiporia mediterranea MF3/22]
MFSRSLSTLPISESSLSALNRAGFKNVSDLGTLSAEQLSLEITIPAFVCEEILKTARSKFELLTQPATSLLKSIRSSFSLSEPVNALLGGGLSRGHVIEFSGPPGSPKDLAILDLIRSVVKAEENVLFLDAQNMTIPSTLRSALKGSSQDIEFQILYGLIALQKSVFTHPQTSLLVLNTLSFLFHTTSIPNSARVSLQEQLKTLLSKVCASKQLMVAVTVQLATKMVGEGGGAANFDTAKKAIMVPQLGDSYLPSSRSHRLIFILNSPRTGCVSLFLLFCCGIVTFPYEG